MNSISIDIETFSSANLQKCGVYRYAESDDFEILLFGYSVDGGAVQVVDLACGEKIPNEIINALMDNSVTKWAFNAMFERVCLSKWLNLTDYLDPTSWKCSMVWSAYMGLPLSLEGVGAVQVVDLPVRQEIAEKYNLKTISDLVEQIEKGEKIRLAGFQEWVERDDGLKRVEEVYDFEYPKDQISLLSMFMGLDAMDQGEVDVCISNTIEPRIKAYDLFVLEDDKSCFPVYNPAPLFRQEIIDAYPDLTDQVQMLTDELTEDAINDLCTRVDVDKESVDKVAADFLKEKGLI
jgi:hypothetical protein